MASAVVQFDQAAMTRLTQAPTGLAGVDLLRRGRNVETLAKRLCPVRKQAGGGQLRASITHFLATDSRGLVCFIGSPLSYAIHVIRGSGIYGPQGTPITPKNARALRWTGPDGKLVFARSSKGTPGRDFLTPALAAARD